MRQITARGKGKVWEQSLKSARKMVRDCDLYYIKRNGAWFRPQAHGYTGDLSAAGTFVGADAKGYLQAEGVTLIATRDLLPRLTKEMRDYVAAAHRLSLVIEQFD